MELYAGSRPLARLGQRYVASIIDDLIISVVVGSILFLSLLLEERFPFVVAVVLSALFTISYEAIFVARRGQTPGKKRAGIRVVTFHGGHIPSPAAALARSVVKLIVGGPLGGVLYLWIGLSLNARGPHDLVAGTVVVRDP